MNFVKQGRKIICVGRNYRDHAKELGNAVPSEPFFFLKPPSSYLEAGASRFIEIPEGFDVHHEVELGAVIGETARDVPAAKAMDAVAGYCLALDLTARNLQNDAKAKGLPWTFSKGYDTFCPVSALIDKGKLRDPQNVSLWLKVNNVMRQNGNTRDMLFPLAELIARISSVMTLERGDLVLTGTPSGVGPILPGDTVLSGIAEAGKPDILTMEFGVRTRTTTRKQG